MAETGTSGLSTASLQKIQSLLSQREAAIGDTSGSSSDTIEALLEAELQTSQDAQLARETLATQQEQFDESIGLSKEQFEESQSQFQQSLAFNEEQLALQQQQADDAADAAQTQGIIDVVSTAATTYLGYKYLTGGSAPAVAAAGSDVSGLTGVSLAGGGGAVSQVGGLTGISSSTAQGLAAGGTETAAINAPSTVTGTGSTGGGVGVGAGIAAVILIDSAIASSQKEGFASFEERQAANLEGFEFGGISPGAAATLDSMGIKSPLDLTKKELGFDPTFGFIDDANKILSSIPGLDAVSDLVADAGSIVCDELNRQGFISDELVKLSHDHRKQFIDNDTYHGYLKLAKPLVWLMKHSRLFVWTHLFIGLGWCLETAHIMEPKKYPKGSLVGKFLIKFIVPLCRKVGC